MAVTEWNMKTFMKGASILTVSALLVKILGAVYRVPFQNLVGDRGFYIYQQVYPIVGLFVVWTTYGAAVAISKLLAEADEASERRAIVNLSFFFLSLLSVVAFVVLFAGSSTIARFMGDSQLAPLLRAGAYILLVMPALAVLKGTFQARGNMMPIAVSSVGEQFTRVAIILAGTWITVQYGTSLYTTGKVAVFGAVIGQAAGVIILAAWSRQAVLVKPAIIQKRKVIQQLTITSLSLSASSLILLLYQLVDAFTILNILKFTGSEEAAMTRKGVYDRGQPLIQLGSLIATTLAMAVVPLIAHQTAKAGIHSAWRFVQVTYRVAIIFGTAAAVGLAVLLPYINVLLFETAAGSNALSIFSLQIVWLSIVLPLCAILQGAGSGKMPAIWLFGGLVVKTAANVLLIPFYGITGAAIAGNLGFAASAVGLLIYFKKIWPDRLAPTRFYAWNTVAIISMAVVALSWAKLSKMIFHEPESRLSAAMASLPAAAVGALVFLGIIMKARILSEKDWYLLPLGNRLAQAQLLLTKKRR